MGPGAGTVVVGVGTVAAGGGTVVAGGGIVAVGRGVADGGEASQRGECLAGMGSNKGSVNRLEWL